MKKDYRAIVVLSNSISSRMTRLGLERSGISPQDCVVITLRPIAIRGADRWLDEVGALFQYPAPPRFSRRGQLLFAGFYLRTAAMLHWVLKQGTVSELFLVNNDNLLTNHLFRWAEARPSVRVTTVIDGLMNFQDIQTRNRASWRIDSKPWIARGLGLQWRRPMTHLSGAFEDRTDRILSFSDVGLHAPPEKVEVVPFEAVTPRRVPAERGGLIAQTGVWQWMSNTDRERFADLFIAFVEEQKFEPLFVKRYPRYDTRFIEERLPAHTVVGEGTTLEDMAADLPARTVVSTNCTALVTLRMLRPDLECIDFGPDFYIPSAYHGDRSVLALQAAVGVRMVPTHADQAAAATG